MSHETAAVLEPVLCTPSNHAPVFSVNLWTLASQFMDADLHAIFIQYLCNSRMWMLCLHDFPLDTLVICICIVCVCTRVCVCAQDLEVQLQQEIGTAQDNIQSLEDSLAEEKRRRGDVEQELLKQKQVRLEIMPLASLH